MMLFNSSLRIFNISLSETDSSSNGKGNRRKESVATIREKNLVFLHLLFDSMFQHNQQLSLRKKNFPDQDVDSCRFLSKNYPSYNSNIGHSNQWSKTFYPNKNRWDILTASKSIAVHAHKKFAQFN
jgi:hypothetical protein